MQFSILMPHSGRHLNEVNFISPEAIDIGGFKALDFFGDGSFYLVETPGHTIGHLGGLARTGTEPDTFIFMGGDLCYDGSQIRPSEHLPIPEEISPHPWKPAVASCSGSLLEKLQMKRGRSAREPIVSMKTGYNMNLVHQTIHKVQPLDADENVLFIAAHDDSIYELDLFPLPANDWKQKGWKEKVRWSFVKKFRHALEPESKM